MNTTTYIEKQPKTSAENNESISFIDKQVDIYDEIKAIIIPDVHGRKFWKDAIPFIEKGVKTIFLGDYIDPYPHEGISKKEAIDNFDEIIKTADENKNIILLIGNHDTTYLYPEARICDCRADKKNFDLIKEMFNYIKPRLKLIVKVGDIMISHAGLHNEWVKRIKPLLKEWYPYKSLIESLNTLVHETDINRLNILSDISEYRGGSELAGSCVWADIREFANENHQYRQIVGHTMCSKPVILKNERIIDIDCQKCFYIDINNDLRILKTNQLVSI